MDLEAIIARDKATGELWFTGPASFTAQAARDRRALLAALPDLLAACKAALGAFEHNHAIDWDDLARAIAKVEDDGAPQGRDR